ncbi:hypothetical protein JL722_5975 [Aureococcus anophagefferens]|nr:hypothetical protein JL722_5975 [Aureococcus anophagefferens]
MLSRLLPSRDQVQIRMMGTKVLVNKMHGSMNPNGREMIIDGCDSITRRVKWQLLRESHIKILHETSAIELLLDILKLWMEDIPVALCAVRATGRIVKTGKEADRVLELGGLLLAEQCKNLHPDDPDMGKAAKDLMRTLTLRSGSLAQKEIRVCRFCAMNNVDLDGAKELARLVNSEKLSGETKVNLVKKKPGAKVDIATLVRKQRPRRQRRALLKGNAAEIVVEAMSSQPDSYAVQWKGCAVVQYMATRLALSAELGKYGVVAELKRVYYDDYESDREVRQQAVWALGAISNVPDNVLRMQEKKVYACVSDLLAKIEDKSILPEDKVALPISLRAVWSDEQLGNFMLAAVEQQAAEEKAKIAEANKYSSYKSAFPRSKRGKYSRVSDEFTKGVPGLVD